jgi:carbonic anhydrase
LKCLFALIVPGTFRNLASNASQAQLQLKFRKGCQTPCSFPSWYITGAQYTEPAHNMSDNINQHLLLGLLAGTTLSLSAMLFFWRTNHHHDQERRQRPTNSNQTTSSQSPAQQGSSRTDSRAPLTLERGFSTSEAHEHNSTQRELSAQRTPDEVLHALQRGNTRFWMGVPERPVVSAFERHALLNQQHPSVAILGCADSRVPISIVFDQGLGDIFAIRVAGNYLDTATEGSLEYAVVHLKVKVLIIMGHEGCGAVGAARLPQTTIDKESKCLCNLLKSLKTGLNEDNLNAIVDKKAADREAVTSNVKKQVNILMNNTVVKDSIDREELKVVGAFYNQGSGIVDFL